MSKRRRASSVASRSVDEDESDSQQAPEPIKKKKKLDPADVIQQLFELIRNFKKEDGSLLCDAFIRAPKRRQEPAYYEVVSNPIDLLKVQQKIKTDEYEDIDDFVADIELLVNNAKAFYRRNMQEYKDANEIWELLQVTKTRLLEEPKNQDDDNKGKIVLKDPEIYMDKNNSILPLLKARKSVGTTCTSTSTSVASPLNIKKELVDQMDDIKKEDEETSDSSTIAEEELNMCEDLFTAVMTVNGDDGHPLHTPFQLLPSKKRYPKYYEVIENPIDLRMIATKIQQGKYANLGELEKDLLQMTRNACTFNEPGSMIYKDAKALRKLVQSKKIEIEQGKYASPGKVSERIRTKRLRSGQTLSAITAAIKSEDEDEDDDGGSIEELEDTDNPCWQLFDTVKSHTNAQGDILSEPFHKLPSKRYYPDYYKEIRNPISLAQISKKLKKGDYGTVSEVAGDLNIMFENAKKYNRPDSKLYKDAVKLQKVMQKKVQELLDFDHQYSASEDDSADEPSVVKKPPKPILPGTTTPAGPSRLLTKGKYLDNIPLKRRLYSLCKCLMNYVCEDGRQPMLMFMEKPSKKLYPDYYEVITKPIDMLTIEANIKAEKYTNQEEILADFKLMFANCRKYNEEGSMIYKDALNLERILTEKVKELGPLPPPDAPLVNNKPGDKKPIKSNPVTPKIKKTYAANTTPKVLDPITIQKLRTLYITIRDYRDPKGRQLSQIFLKLPSKVEYPDYYEVIKKPINLEQISQKLKANAYEGLEDLCGDFILMFDNACKYNEPDSQIYKDALTLQRVAIQTKLQLRQDEHSVPDVPAAVQELLTSLFISVYNHQDEEGRCFSDSMQELPEHDEVDGKKVRALSLDLIKRRLDGGQYKRLDTFQDDVFSCFQRARSLSRSDSQVFEDSVELQSFFIRQRDELCRNGDLLHSPALNYTLMDLSSIVDEERQTKQAQEQQLDGDQQDLKLFIKEEPGAGTLAGTADNALSYNQQVYRIGDFVYAEGKERGMEPIILNIQRLWTNQEGGQMLYGNQYFRPNETYHVTTRKFLQKEVFKTEQNVAIPLNQVLGRCCVLSVKDYFRSKPEGVDEKDVYVCESRYSARARAFKKIKNWPPSLMTGYKLIPRDEILEPKRIMSVFRQRVEKHKEEIAELEEQEKLVEKEKPNIPVNPPIKNEDGWIHYEQLNTPAGVIKTGDCVYLKSEGKPLIAQADTIWTNKEGEGFFRGPWMVMPTETPHSPSRLFYKQEVLLSTLEDTHPTNNIVSKCVVLEHGEYISCRPTEYLESDVYVCESIYDEVKRTVRELPREGLKKYTHSAQVTQDEIYFFRRLINPPKVPAHPGTYTPAPVESHPPPQVTTTPTPTPSSTFNPVPPYENSVDSDVLMEDSMDGAPPSVSSGETPHITVSTPLGVKKAKGTGKKLVTGYILYSGDVRKSITVSNPDCNFGEVSRIVGNEWRKLPATEKAAWEERAARINEENKLDLDLNQTWSPGSAGPPTETVFECCWDTCDWQFEDCADAIEHAVADATGHVFQWFQMPSASEADYQCQWRGCTRTRKTIPPFPNVQRLARHVKEVHLLKSTGKVILSESRSKHYVPSRKAAMAKAAVVSQMAAAVSGFGNQSRSTPSPLSQNGGSVNGKPAEPLFITVPPRPQRLLHSEAYIKYIEGLTAGNNNINNWDKQLRATQATIENVDQTKLPANWLSTNAINNHATSLLQKPLKVDQVPNRVFRIANICSLQPK